MGLGKKMELRPGWVSGGREPSGGGVCSRKRDGGIETENGSAARVLREIASGCSNTRARKSKSWNKTEFWSIGELGVCVDRQEQRGLQHPLPGQASPSLGCGGTSLR